MKVKSLKANQTEITLNDGTMVFVSYETPVAAFIPGEGVIKTEKKWSGTTSKHINQWIADTFSHRVTISETPQSKLDSMI